ncbi:PD-(D/E)XK nuclease superfamily protein [Flavobacteriaceae bacterium MAR_2010_72]|nr:PD-(D/E)XK nuclease superfamily protein [Flavobacteriaceae bacterium MAR_2010_72]TVZ58389.1 PD-(D/E)XK nuclease superfamily protein [Flavobacteriaceae bacterium MAR_2010_105]
MTSFLEDVIVDLQNQALDISEITFILPSKRAGFFLRNHIAQCTPKTIFAPEILSIETFIESVADITYATNTELLFEFYEAYLVATPKDSVEPFDDFSKWAQLLIQDFNEIDRYLIPPDSIFNYLGAIKELNHWSLDQEQTPYIKNYISFWKRLPVLYNTFKNLLLEKKKGYQGLVYREAVTNLEQYIAAKPKIKYVFVGFNALNKAEEIIIQELLQQDLALIYWDIDETFINDPLHDAGLFTRQYKTEWPYFRKHPFTWTTKNYSTPKNIQVIGVPKQVGQVKQIGALLNQLDESKKNLSNTAVILGNEHLLIPLLNSIPEQINTINVTMGLPLRSIPMTSLFESLFKIHKTSNSTIYYKDVNALLSNSYIKPLLFEGSKNYADALIKHIQENNIAYLNLSMLNSFSPTHSALFNLLFSNWNNDAEIAIDNTIKLILLIKENLQQQARKNTLDMEYLYRFNVVFTELQNLNTTYKHINSVSALFGLYKEIIANETLDFKGEPLQGLQIMGMLESRVLDFETIIISSVNEGILPAGKSTNSFIPFDVKIEHGLPTYKEKDAVYTNHFYRLLQRAKQVYILYNTEPDVLKGGEKSRLISQLEIENIHDITPVVVGPKVKPTVITLKQIEKTDAIMERLKAVASDGFSPSSLTNYIRNPIDLYYEKILGIKPFEELEETVAANTLGSVIHHTLETLYTPIINQFLSKDYITSLKPLIAPTVKAHFKSLFKDGDFSKGKNLIVFEIAKRYVSNFLEKELEAINAGNTIKIIGLEVPYGTYLNLPELDFPVRLKGTVDRIDEFNGVTRIIDYKSGKVIQSQIEIVDWEDLLTDYTKFSKSFQVLSYAYLLHQQDTNCLPVEGGIISFKNLQGDYFLKFGKKDSSRSRTKDQLINQDTLEAFFIQLKKLILELCNPKIPFVEKPL